MARQKSPHTARFPEPGPRPPNGAAGPRGHCTPPSRMASPERDCEGSPTLKGCSGKQAGSSCGLSRKQAALCGLEPSRGAGMKQGAGPRGPEITALELRERPWSSVSRDSLQPGLSWVGGTAPPKPSSESARPEEQAQLHRESWAPCRHISLRRQVGAFPCAPRSPARPAPCSLPPAWARASSLSCCWSAPPLRPSPVPGALNSCPPSKALCQDRGTQAVTRAPSEPGLSRVSDPAVGPGPQSRLAGSAWPGGPGPPSPLPLTRPTAEGPGRSLGAVSRQNLPPNSASLAVMPHNFWKNKMSLCLTPL